MKEVIMQVQSFSADYPKAPIYVGDLVRCKDCRHANECHKSVQYTRNEPNMVTIGYTKIDFCSHGERREE